MDYVVVVAWTMSWSLHQLCRDHYTDYVTWLCGHYSSYVVTTKRTMSRDCVANTSAMSWPLHGLCHVTVTWPLHRVCREKTRDMSLNDTWQDDTWHVMPTTWGMSWSRHWLCHPITLTISLNHRQKFWCRAWRCMKVHRGAYLGKPILLRLIRKRYG